MNANTGTGATLVTGAGFSAVRTVKGVEVELSRDGIGRQVRASATVTVRNSFSYRIVAHSRGMETSSVYSFVRDFVAAVESGDEEKFYDLLFAAQMDYMKTSFEKSGSTVIVFNLDSEGLDV